MKRSAMAMFAICLVLTGLGFSPARSHAGTYEVEFRDNFVVDSAYGGETVSLSANVFWPKAAEGIVFPAIICPSSWGLNEHEYTVQAKRFAEEGYVVFSYTPRGFYKSTGMIEVAGPEDMADLSACIDWVVEKVPADPDRIGMAGISYGAGISLLGSAHDERIKTVFSMSGWAELGEALYGAETVRLVWGEILLITGKLTGDLDPIVNEYFDDLLHDRNVEEVLECAAVRSPSRYLDTINRRGVPIYISQNWGDELFQPNAEMDFYSRLTTHDKRLGLYLGIHATAELGGLLGIPNEVWANAHAWFDYWLKGLDSPLMHEPRVSMHVKNSDEVLYFRDWPSREIVSQSYYLGPRTPVSNGKLQATPQLAPAVDVIRAGFESGATTGIPVLSPFFEAHTEYEVKVPVAAIDKTTAVVFTSDPLPSTRMIAGVPTLEIWVEPHDTEFEVIAYLYDIDSRGIATLITHGPVSEHDATPGQVTKVPLNLIGAAYKIRAGHRIGLALDTFDAEYAVPTFEPYTLTFHYGNTARPKLTVPYKVTSAN